MRNVILVLMVIMIPGCTPEKRNDVSACQMEGDRFYQGYQADNVDDPRSRYIISCMAAKGYAFDISPADCDSKRPLATQAACYVSSGWAARALDRFLGQ